MKITTNVANISHLKTGKSCFTLGKSSVILSALWLTLKW